MAALIEFKEDFLRRLKASTSKEDAVTVQRFFSEAVKRSPFSETDKESFYTFTQLELETHLNLMTHKEFKQDFLDQLKTTDSEKEAVSLLQSFSKLVQRSRLKVADKESFYDYSKAELERHLTLLREAPSLATNPPSEMVYENTNPPDETVDKNKTPKAVTSNKLLQNFRSQLKNLYVESQLLELMSTFHQQSASLKEEEREEFNSLAQFEINQRIKLIKKNIPNMPSEPISALSYLSDKLTDVGNEIETLYPLETDSLSTLHEKEIKFYELSHNYAFISRLITLNEQYKTAKQQNNNTHEIDQKKSNYVRIISEIMDALKEIEGKLKPYDKLKYQQIKLTSTPDHLTDTSQKHQRLSKIQLAVSCAFADYSEWSMNKNAKVDGPRGAMGFFTSIRHGSKGVADARLLERVVRNAITEEEAILQINTILRASNLNRHSFGSFLLDELRRLPEDNETLWQDSQATRWATIKPIEEGYNHNKYTQQQVNRVTTGMDNDIAETRENNRPNMR